MAITDEALRKRCAEISHDLAAKMFPVPEPDPAHRRRVIIAYVVLFIATTWMWASMVALMLGADGGECAASMVAAWWLHSGAEKNLKGTG